MEDLRYRCVDEKERLRGKMGALFKALLGLGRTLRKQLRFRNLKYPFILQFSASKRIFQVIEKDEQKYYRMVVLSLIQA
jgi:hypothetical protein